MTLLRPAQAEGERPHHQRRQRHLSEAGGAAAGEQCAHDEVTYPPGSSRRSTSGG